MQFILPQTITLCIVIMHRKQDKKINEKKNFFLKVYNERFNDKNEQKFNEF